MDRAFWFPPDCRGGDQARFPASHTNGALHGFQSYLDSFNREIEPDSNIMFSENDIPVNWNLEVVVGRDELRQPPLPSNSQSLCFRAIMERTQDCCGNLFIISNAAPFTI